MISDWVDSDDEFEYLVLDRTGGRRSQVSVGHRSQVSVGHCVPAQPAAMISDWVIVKLNVLLVACWPVWLYLVLPVYTHMLAHSWWPHLPHIVGCGRVRVRVRVRVCVCVCVC
jgi:hypothetical protein